MLAQFLLCVLAIQRSVSMELGRWAWTPYCRGCVKGSLLMAHKVDKKLPPHSKGGMRVILWDETPPPVESSPPGSGIASSNQPQAEYADEDHEGKYVSIRRRSQGGSGRLQTSFVIRLIRSYTIGGTVYARVEDMACVKSTNLIEERGQAWSSIQLLHV
jgi:hypothetical protein